MTPTDFEKMARAKLEEDIVAYRELYRRGMQESVMQPESCKCLECSKVLGIKQKLKELKYRYL